MTLTHLSHVKTNSKKSHGERLLQIERHLKYLLSENGPYELVIRERGFSKMPATTQALFRVVGVADARLANYEHVAMEYPPISVKKEVTGNSKADKSEVANAVLRYFPKATFVNDDESDAVAVILCHLLKEGLIERK